jgi:hypothetical protein
VKALGDDVNRLAQRLTEDVKNGSAGAEKTVRQRMDELTRRAAHLQDQVQGQLKSGADQVNRTTTESLARTREQLQQLGRKLDEQVGQGGTGGP